MRVALIDLWLDLRHKRLWPVALALVLALVAVPVLLRPDERPVPTAPAAPSDGEAALEALPEDASRAALVGSDLELFPPADPFGVRAEASPTAATPRSIGRSSGGRSTAGRGSSPSEPTPTPVIPTPAPLDAPVPTPPDPTPTPVPDRSPAANTPAPAPTRREPDPEPKQAEPIVYTETVDFRFGRRGSERTRRAVARLQAIPDDEAPLITFVGATLSGASAVFLLDGMAERGDGACQPTPEQCTLLSLRLDRDHDQSFLTDDAGRKYSVRLTAIDRVPLAEARRRAAVAKRAKAGAGRASE